MDASQKVEQAAAGGLSRPPRFLKAATSIMHLCGLMLSRKRYIERSPAVQWAVFHLQRQLHFRSDLLFNLSYYSKRQFKKRQFEKLKHVLCNCPKQRRQKDLLQIQTCLKTNGAFQRLPLTTQLQLCQVSIYQKYEAGTLIIKQGHVATECYLVLSGRLEFTMADVKDRTFASETLCETEEGDFLGEICLLTNRRRPASVLCKSEVEAVVIGKKDFKNILGNVWNEKHHATCHFLRKLPLFTTWPPEKIDLLVHCSLQRFYRAGSIVATNSLESYFLVIVTTGRCMEVAKLDPKQINTQDDGQKTPRCRDEKEKSLSTEAPCSSPEERKDICDLEEKGKQKQMKEGSDGKKTHRQKKAIEAPLAPQFLKIRTLEQSEIFGLAEMMDKLSALQLTLVSEGAECLFIPKRLFLEGAPAESRQIAVEMLSGYPTERMILKNYNVQRAWNIYKTELLQQQFEKPAKPGSMKVCSC